MIIFPLYSYSYSISRVDAFFSCEVNARHLFHVPTFRASLALPPSHAQFPHTAVLHAICAVGSLYSAAIPPAPMPNFDVMPAGNCLFFCETYRSFEFAIR